MIVLRVMSVVWVSIAMLGVPAAAQDSNPTGVARFHVNVGNVTHSVIEQRIGDFQNVSNLPPSTSMLMAMGVGSSRSRNYGEAEFAYVFGSDMKFMDNLHYIEVQEWFTALWYRRLVPIFWGFNFAPGAGVGYSWARVNVGKEGPSSADTDDELGASTSVLSGSDLMFVAGMQTDIKLHQWGSGEVLYLNLDYRYRLKREYTAAFKNDGDLFFPDGSEFEFDGHYFGVGVLIRIPDLSAKRIDD